MCLNAGYSVLDISALKERKVRVKKRLTIIEFEFYIINFKLKAFN